MDPAIGAILTIVTVSLTDTEPSVNDAFTITPLVVPLAVAKFVSVIVTLSPVTADKYELGVSVVPSSFVIVQFTVAVVFCFCAVNVVVCVAGLGFPDES